MTAPPHLIHQYSKRSLTHMTVGRFAPSPSGRIHLGNILCCLLAWLSARQKGGNIVLRIEDLDSARCPGAMLIR